MTSHIFSRSGRLHLGGIALVSAVVVALSGCNSAGEPEPVATASSLAAESTSPSPTPTATATYRPADATGRAQNVPVPVLPDVAKTETKEGAQAFASYWFKVLSYSYETGDLVLLRSITPSSCQSCQKPIQAIQDWHSQGRWLMGGTITTPAVSTTFEKDGEAKYQVAVQAIQEPLSYFRADGTLAHAEPNAANTGNLLILSFTEDSWKLHDIGSIVG